jgi:H+/gluconate symporter-like permease
MDSLPGTPQIQNIIPTTFFKTTPYAAPMLGTLGGLFILTVGIIYLNYRRAQAARAGEGYGTGHINELEPVPTGQLANPFLAILPLFVVGIMNLVFTRMIPKVYGVKSVVQLTATAKPIEQAVPAMAGIWAVESALALGILTVIIFAFPRIKAKFGEGTKAAVGGALLASMNTATEYGFGATIAALPGFMVIRDALLHIPNPLVNEAVTVNVLAGVTGSASGGLSIALAAMGDTTIAHAIASGIPPEVLHRVASMASGGMDTLPHNGAVITLLAVTGLTHKQSYRDIFTITCIKTMAVFLIIALYYLGRGHII